MKNKYTMIPHKNIRQALLGTLVLGLLTVGCKDDFNEENLLENQVSVMEQQSIDKAQRAADALNTAGEMLSYSVKVVTNNNEPVAGANVTLQAAAQTGAEFDLQTVTSDANGEAFFPRAVIGGNILSISADGYFDVTASVEFGAIEQGRHYEIIEGVIVPTPVAESSIVPLFSDASGEEVATISGMVTIETDLTNTTPEVPQDITLRANLRNFAFQFNTEGSVPLSIYSFDKDQTIGTATVDNTTGAYSMTVPATADGLPVELLIPNVSANQRVAIAERNGQLLDRPEYAEVPTNFGPTWKSDYDLDIPTVPGAIWSFPTPPPAGKGFDFTYERLGRPITTGFIHNLNNYLTPGQLPGSPAAIVIQATSLGAGYTESPSLTFTDPTGTGAVAETHIEFAIDGATLINGGPVGFNDIELQLNAVYDSPANVIVNGNVQVDEDAETNLPLDDIPLITVFREAGTQVTQENIDQAIAQAIADKGNGFDPENLFQVSDWITNLRFVNGDIEAKVSSMAIGQIFQFEVTEGGEGYTDAEFVFSGGGENITEQAAIDVLQFGTQWAVTPDNTGITVPYTIPPPYIGFEHFAVGVGNQPPAINISLNDENLELIGPAAEVIKVNDQGEIEFINQVSPHILQSYSVDPPRTLIKEPTSSTAKYLVGSTIVDDNGSITAYDFNFKNEGSGYTEQFGVTVLPAAEGAPGSGAQVDLTGGEFLPNGEYIWGGSYEIKSGGSGYLRNLNQQPQQGYSGELKESIKSGEVYLLNIRYGTGARQEDVDGIEAKPAS